MRQVTVSRHTISASSHYGDCMPVTAAELQNAAGSTVWCAERRTMRVRMQARNAKGPQRPHTKGHTTTQPELPVLGERLS